MKISIIAFTDQGRRIGHFLSEQLIKSGHACDTDGLFLGKNGRGEKSGFLNEWTRKAIAEKDALIFISATGIAVRAMAPFLKNKSTDPAVVVLDDRGTWSISLTSGHLGRANELARQAAKLLGAQAVITTATDVNHVFAVDLWAQEQNLYITSMPRAKKISAALLRGEAVGFSSDYEWSGLLPKGFVSEPQYPSVPEQSVRVSVFPPKGKDHPSGVESLVGDPEKGELWLIPRSVILGIGCRKNTLQAEIEQAVINTLASYRLDIQSVTAVASIDLKKEEEGLMRFCEQYGWDFITYSADQLMAVAGAFASSLFVRQATGADNVCERAAALASQGGSLLIGKTCCHKMTVAAAQKPICLTF